MDRDVLGLAERSSSALNSDRRAVAALLDVGRVATRGSASSPVSSTIELMAGTDHLDGDRIECHVADARSPVASARIRLPIRDRPRAPMPGSTSVVAVHLLDDRRTGESGGRAAADRAHRSDMSMNPRGLGELRAAERSSYGVMPHRDRLGEGHPGATPGRSVRIDASSLKRHDLRRVRARRGEAITLVRWASSNAGDHSGYRPWPLRPLPSGNATANS